MGPHSVLDFYRQCDTDRMNQVNKVKCQVFDVCGSIAQQKKGGQKQSPDLQCLQNRA